VNVKTREALIKRDLGVCWHCGSSEVTVQHRGNRGMGGSKLKDNPANLILLCWFVNFEMEASDKKARIAELYGWKISKWADATTIRVWHEPLQAWFLLDDDWHRNLVI
jgi:predicted molibdopterin-dependent oxidoreductase YjgC